VVVTAGSVSPSGARWALGLLDRRDSIGLGQCHPPRWLVVETASASSISITGCTSRMT